MAPGTECQDLLKFAMKWVSNAILVQLYRIKSGPNGKVSVIGERHQMQDSCAL